MAYVSMFPQLVAGPIVRYSEVQSQLARRGHTLDKFYRGVLYFQFGLAKKVLIADNLAGIADQAFGTGSFAPVGAAAGLVPEYLGFVDAWIGAAAFAFQNYCDFSGYSDMAIGLGLMIGFTFPINFDRPYAAVSFTDFWRRRHISLSTWLRGYLYIPLAGSRKGGVRTYVNLSLTMLLGGPWHGAQWTFVAWGAYQGFWLVVERLRGGRAVFDGLPRVCQIAATFALVLVGWALFKAPDFPSAGVYLGAMFGVNGAGLPVLELHAPFHGLLFAVAAAATWGFPTTAALVSKSSLPAVLFAQPVFLLALVHLHLQQVVPFLYFRF